ncbi:MAG: hypothetical protein JRS35_17030 [Deltaproteobacteria bacterium]|nr:hypothetical protein [Deltaproteobacteria bacterium]
MAECGVAPAHEGGIARQRMEGRDLYVSPEWSVPSRQVASRLLAATPPGGQLAGGGSDAAKAAVLLF